MNVDMNANRIIRTLRKAQVAIREANAHVAESATVAGLHPETKWVASDVQMQGLTERLDQVNKNLAHIIEALQLGE